MKLHVLSDLHLGLAPMEVADNHADLIILAGDIARPQAACDWARRLTKPVIFVAGNHEFYGGNLQRTLHELRSRCAGSHVHLLERDAWVFAGVRFLGTALWSDFRLFDDDEIRQRAMAESSERIRDFQRITVGSDPPRIFTPEDSAALFDSSLTWLEAALREPFGGPTVVITHHAPSPKSIQPRFAGSLLNGCFVSSAEHLMGDERVQLWIHGHTHDSFDYAVRGTRVVCNPRGYVVQETAEKSSLRPGHGYRGLAAEQRSIVGQSP